MKKVTVEASIKYDVLIGRGLLKETGAYAADVFGSCKLCVVSDETVFGLYGNIVKTSLADAGYETCEFTFPSGEQSKKMDTVARLLEFMAEAQLTRSDALVALGGGITGDITGFAASCYLRGVPFIQIPTTLLAAVDSSVGGKTGVNLVHGKNLAGAFWQPSLVLCDCSTFDTLTNASLLDGIAEIIKYGVIADRELFNFVLGNNNSLFLKNNIFEKIIEKCVIIKSRIVSADERDTGIRQLLNFGHTLGHAIEQCSDYRISHGQAVALGMLHIARAADISGVSTENCAEKIEQALRQYGFKLMCDFSADELCEAALIDKKRKGDFITLVIPDKIGECRLEKMNLHLFKEFVKRGF